MTDLSTRLQAALSGRYRIERELGHGGMATVFLAEDLKHSRAVALKVLSPEVAQAVGPERFLREIETVARLTHPHILPLHDSGEAAGLLYYTMPFVTGESLRDRLGREKQLAVEEALRLTHEVAAALEHAHAAGVIHRDIKPENILLEDGHAVVADFGIARAVASTGTEKLTATGVVVGTPAYMAPEQAMGGGVDARCDQYGLGCVLYEMLAGQAPYVGPTVESVVFQHLNAAVPRITVLRPGVPAGVEQVIEKALAKAPADRYASTGEFTRALEAAPDVVVARPAKSRRARWIAVATVGALAALTGLAAWQQWWPFERAEAPRERKDWILVAEFDSAPEDSAVAEASHDLLCAALDQSRFVATVPADQTRQALRAAGKPANTRVDAEVAKELAYRSAVRAVLEGRIGRLGPAYSIVLRVMDADTARVILTESAVARNEDGLVPTLGALSKRLRERLGENRRALAATREMTLAATPSFEAYRLYAQAVRVMLARADNRQVIRLCQTAIALDPDFAVAWWRMAACYLNLAYPESALICLDEALSRPGRLTESQRQLVIASRARSEGDMPGMLAALDRVLADDPNYLPALTSSGVCLLTMGRFEEALERHRRAMRLRPFGPTNLDWGNVEGALQLLGRFDEARDAASHEQGAMRLMDLQAIEMAAGRWAAAESIAVRHLDDPQMNENIPGGFLAALGFCQFARGDMRAASESFGRIETISRERRDLSNADWYRRYRFELSAMTGGVFPPPPAASPEDTSLTMIVFRGYHAVAASNLALARQCLRASTTRPSRQLAAQGAAIALLEAQLEMLAGRAEEAIRLLRPLAAERVEPGSHMNGIGLTWVRWSLADAFERLGQPDSAAVALGRDLAFTLEPHLQPLVHHRLAILCARMGRVADAERHLAAVERAWDRPDPAVRRMLDQARAAVTSARGMARPRG